MYTHMGRCILASVCTLACAHLCLRISMAVLSGKGAVCVSFGTITPQKCVLLILNIFLLKLLVRICFALPHILPPPQASVFYKQGKQVGREGRGEKR